MRIHPKPLRVRTAGILLAMAAGACGQPAARMAPAPPPAPIPPPPSPVPAWRTLMVCVLEGETLRDVPVQYSVVSGDTLMDGRPFAEAYPVTERFAGAARWYHEHELIELDGRRYTKYAPPRSMRPGSLVALGRAHRGVPLFVEAGESILSSVLYVPVRPGCEFQTYQWDLMGNGVRGG
jgi:hypothetical protein